MNADAYFLCRTYKEIFVGWGGAELTRNVQDRIIVVLDGGYLYLIE